MNIRPTRPFRWLALVALALPLAAHAERYRVDLIVFIDRSGPAGESPQPLQVPDVGRALEPFETVPLRNAGIELLPDESFGMTEEWSRLRNSKNHQPILRVAWLQKDPPAERTTSLRLHWGSPFTEVATLSAQRVYPVDGYVALLAGRYLHLDAEFVYTQADTSGELRSFRLKERRRLRRDELNHLDSPRLGVLMRATRAPEGKDGRAASAPAKPAAKPATPAPKKK